MPTHAQQLLQHVSLVRSTIRFRNDMLQRSKFPNQAEKKLPLPVRFDVEDSCLSQLLNELQLNYNDYMLFSLALGIHLEPQLLYPIGNAHPKLENYLSTIRGKNFSGQIPSGLTWLYLVAGNETDLRLEAMAKLEESPLIRYSLLQIDPGFTPEPYLSGPLMMDSNLLHRIITNQEINLNHANNLDPLTSYASESAPSAS